MAGRLFTDQQKVLTCGLVALETRLGWTVMGKVYNAVVDRSSSMMVTSLLCNKDMQLRQLWELDVLGIRDPVEKKSKEQLAVAAKEFFLNTININEEGRYEVRMPWIEGHSPLPTNYSLAQKRFESMLSKLKVNKLHEAYNEIFNE